MDRVVTDRRRLARTPWRRLTTRPVYENRWIRVREDQVALPDGRTTIYGVVECAGCVGVLPFLDPDTVVLVGQYRYVAGDFYWEMPTGSMAPGESEEAAVQRELGEEAGYAADRLVTTASEVLQRFAIGERFDVILCDLMMPVMTGMDLHEELERLDPAQAARMVSLTGGAFTPRAREFLSRVTNPKLEKPFDPRGLRSLVRGLLSPGGRPSL